ncbi:transmembrane protease serine 12-like [Leucoraja erinacea]|uniref:transmembrane protease serine 12-like n=1 Tax=Leucoraja erinaceus TaxID=7782 RepID=UPI0024558915|nr:transmembrane protease serine 12-like [Leucoraja erinacea]
MDLVRTIVLLAVTSWVLVCGQDVQGCGHRPMAGPPFPSRVVGGQEALPGAWPWQVSLQLEHGGMSAHTCGGVVIDHGWVLTAAHCVVRKGRHQRRWLVVTGLHSRSHPGPLTRWMRLRRLHLHPGFRADTMEHDIALLQLHRALPYDAGTQPVCLPPAGTQHDAQPCFISGWGARQADGPGSENLQEAELQLIPNWLCNHPNWYNGIITSHMLCAGYENGSVDGCQGDSGGPLQCYSWGDQRFYLMGITSCGTWCGLPRKVGDYTRVSAYIGWIEADRAMSRPAGISGGIPTLTLLSLTLLSLTHNKHIYCLRNHLLQRFPDGYSRSARSSSGETGLGLSEDPVQTANPGGGPLNSKPENRTRRIHLPMWTSGKMEHMSERMLHHDRLQQELITKRSPHGPWQQLQRSSEVF